MYSNLRKYTIIPVIKRKEEKYMNPIIPKSPEVPKLSESEIEFLTNGRLQESSEHRMFLKDFSW